MDVIWAPARVESVERTTMTRREYTRDQAQTLIEQASSRLEYGPNRERREKRLHKMVGNYLDAEARLKAKLKDRDLHAEAAAKDVWVDGDGKETPYAVDLDVLQLARTLYEAWQASGVKTDDSHVALKG